eukprot:4026188-Pleurochrysis_carterae.AAC.1
MRSAQAESGSPPNRIRTRTLRCRERQRAARQPHDTDSARSARASRAIRARPGEGAWRSTDVSSQHACIQERVGPSEGESRREADAGS